MSINPLEVQSRLDGLVEKFRIHNNDDLAEALRTRLNELTEHPCKYTPDILYLLLQLSDKPSRSVRTEDPGLLNHEPLLAQSIWSEILAQDSLDNAEGLWYDIDYADTSEDEDCFELDHEASPDPSIGRSGDLEASIVGLEDLILPVNSAITSNTLETYLLDDASRIGRPSSYLATETEIFRDVLSMLQGLPTSTFVQLESGRYLFSRNCHLSHLSTEPLTHLLNSLAVIGNTLENVRKWTKQPTKIPSLQAVQFALSSRLGSFTQYMFTLEALALGHGPTGTISLLNLLQCIQYKSRTIRKLSEMLETSIGSSGNKRSFGILECLYASTCDIQAIGDFEGYHDMAQIFLESFETYLKPVQQWMEDGDLAESNDTFFVSRNESRVPLEALWDEQYAITQLENGHALAPYFVDIAAKKILNTGKSIRFLKALDQATASHNPTWKGSRINIKVISGEQDMEKLIPFSELFESSFNEWITERYKSSSIMLRQHLETHCGLHDTLNILEYIYLQRDGARSSNVSYSIFDMIDQDKSASADSVILTQLFREAFEPLLGLACQRLSVRFSDDLNQLQCTERSIRVLESLELSYSIPWPVANIIRPGGLVDHQRVFIFLMQTQLVIYTLSRQLFGQISLITRQNSAAEFRLALSLRHRLLWFANSILAYLTETVAVNSTRMREDLAKANDLDDMIEVHKSYVLRLGGQCLLSKELTPIHSGIISLFDLAMSFAEAHLVYSSKAVPSVLRRSAGWTSANPRTSQVHSEDAVSHSLSGDDDDVARGQGNRRIGTSPEMAYVYRLKRMHQTFSNLHSFILAGLRGVHRAGVEPSWEVLADLLTVEYGTKSGNLRG